MQKLEQILHAEDSARLELATAREEADRIAREAVAEAELVRASAKREATARTVVIREAIIAQALREADLVRSEAAGQLEVTLRAAEARVGEAAAVVARELIG